MADLSHNASTQLWYEESRLAESWEEAVKRWTRNMWLLKSVWLKLVLFVRDGFSSGQSQRSQFGIIFSLYHHSNRYWPHHRYWHVPHPVNTVISDGPYQFICQPVKITLPAAGNNYIYMKLKIVLPINLLCGTYSSKSRFESTAASVSHVRWCTVRQWLWT